MTSPKETPQWLLERMALDEVPAVAAGKAQAARATSQAALDSLASDTHRFLEEHPAAQMSARIRQRLEAPRPSKARPAAVWIPIVALAAAMVVFAVVPRATPGERLKGLHPALLLFRNGTAGAEPLQPGALVHAGDRVQLRYVAGGARQGAVLSVDGAGRITRHFPLEGTRSAPLVAGSEVSLPNAYELDSAPAFERFVLVTSDRAFELQPVMDAMNARHEANAPALVLPFPASQTSFLLRKAP